MTWTQLFSLKYYCELLLFEYVEDRTVVVFQVYRKLICLIFCFNEVVPGCFQCPHEAGELFMTLYIVRVHRFSKLCLSSFTQAL